MYEKSLSAEQFHTPRAPAPPRRAASRQGGQRVDKLTRGGEGDRRPRDLATSNFPQLRGFCLANYTSDPVFRARLAQAPEENVMAAVAHWAGVFGNPLTWDDLPWLRSLTTLPLILKGICHPDDARRALDEGADGIYVSNHGGRQANGGLPALDCLPGVVEVAAGTAGPVRLGDPLRRGRHQGDRPWRDGRGHRAPRLRADPTPRTRARCAPPRPTSPGRRRLSRTCRPPTANTPRTPVDAPSQHLLPRQGRP